jgi:hypothetical protein
MALETACYSYLSAEVFNESGWEMAQLTKFACLVAGVDASAVEEITTSDLGLSDCHSRVVSLILEQLSNCAHFRAASDELRMLPVAMASKSVKILGATLRALEERARQETSDAGTGFLDRFRFLDRPTLLQKLGEKQKTKALMATMGLQDEALAMVRELDNPTPVRDWLCVCVVCVHP